MSCSGANKQVPSPPKIVYIFPNGLDSIAYAKEQSQLRKQVLESYAPKEEIVLWKYVGRKKLSIYYKQTCLFDSSIIVPAQFNLDNGLDFTTHNFVSNLTCTLSKDTLLNLNITKDYFLDQLDSNLKNYGVLFKLDGADNLVGDNDSITVIFNLAIPATLFQKRFLFKTDYKGNFILREYDLPKGYVR
jgi:hypothetical protein